MKKDKYRIIGIDFLRIVSTIAILLHHYQQYNNLWLPGKINFFGGVIDFSLAVEIFFLLSGFMSDHNQRHDSSQTIASCIKKFARKYFWLMASSSLVCELLNIAHLHGGRIHWIFPNEVDFLGTMVTALGISSWGLFAEPKINWTFWFLSVLLLISILNHFLQVFSLKYNVKTYYFYILMIILGMIMKYAGVSAPFFNAKIGRGFVCWYLGAIVSKVYRYYINRFSTTMILLFLIFLLPLCVGLVMYLSKHSMKGSGIVIIFFIFPMLICIMASDFTNRLFEWISYKDIGRLCLNIYIWHHPILLLQRILIEAGIFYEPNDVNPGRIQFVLISILVGILSLYFFKLMNQNCVERVRNKTI